MTPREVATWFVAEQRAKWGREQADLVLDDVTKFLSEMPAHGRIVADQLLTEERNR